jgi:hypothetical protein
MRRLRKWQSCAPHLLGNGRGAQALGAEPGGLSKLDSQYEATSE